jgi:hypothetical protein
MAEQAAADEAMEKFKADKEAEEKAKAAKEAKIAAKKAAQKAKETLISNSGELWTANMPEQYLDGYIQTQVGNIRHQLA